MASARAAEISTTSTGGSAAAHASAYKPYPLISSTIVIATLAAEPASVMKPLNTTS